MEDARGYFNKIASKCGIEEGPMSVDGYAATGERVVILMAHGIAEEGKEPPEWFDTPEQAWSAYRDHFRVYLAANNDDGAKLYWRRIPELEQLDEKYQIYSRLLVSSKPELVKRCGYEVWNGDTDALLKSFRDSAQPSSVQAVRLPEIMAVNVVRLEIRTDLSETGIEDATRVLVEKFEDQPRMLIAFEDDAFKAGQLCERYGFGFVMLPDLFLGPHGWALAGHHNVVWSPGA